MSGSAPLNRTGRAPGRVRLRPEALEGRTVPSTLTVLNRADSGDGSLRAAILAADANPGADTIDFAPGVRGTITLTSGPLLITDPLAINGPGANLLTVSGNDASRVFEAIGPFDGTTWMTNSISELTISHGYALETGGGVVNAAENRAIYGKQGGRNLLKHSIGPTTAVPFESFRPLLVCLPPPFFIGRFGLKAGVRK